VYLKTGEDKMRKSRFGKLNLIISPSHEKLGLAVANVLGIKPLKIQLEHFNNGELRVRRIGDVSGSDVCIVSSLHARYDTIGELTRIYESLQTTQRVFGVFPFVRDGKSDHPKRFGEVAAYKNTAEAISSSGVEAAVIFDQHSTQHQLIFDTNHHRLKTVHHIFLLRLLIEYAQKIKFDKIVPLDRGGFNRNHKAAVLLGRIKDMAYILKERDEKSLVVDPKKMIIIGDIKGKDVVSFEDMVQGGGTAAAGSVAIKIAGAKSVSIFAVHPDFEPKTFKRLNPLLENGTIDRLVLIDTLPIIDREKWHKNLTVISPAKFLAKVIEHVHLEKHMRGFFLGAS
jgi:ribose-phosphate pyrophosphokinase